MEHLNWELSVLSKAIPYNNLSGAAQHVGISQPQLSRIVARIEEQTGLTLLDREARRKSAWTPHAFKLAEIYSKTARAFAGEIQGLSHGAQVTHVKVGALEGLVPVASRFCELLFKSGIQVVELDVEDLDDLEAGFFKGAFDFILTFREPGRKKFKNSRKLGYQSLKKTGAGKVQVLSSFEFSTGTGVGAGVGAGVMVNPTLVSNSLEVRRDWITRRQGAGVLPSAIRAQKSAGDVPALLLAGDAIPAMLWAVASKLG